MLTLICDCNGALALRQETFQQSLGAENPVLFFSRLCRDEMAQFIQQQGEERPPVVVGCKELGDLVSRMLAEAGWSPGHVVSSDLLYAFRTSSTPEEAHAKALHMLRAELAAYRSRRAPFGLPVNVGDRVLVASDGDGAWELCRLLAPHLRVTWLARRTQNPCQGCREGAAASAEDSRYCQQQVDHSIPTLTGALEAVSGHIGAFRAEMRLDQPINFDRCVRCLKCVDACPEGAISGDLVLDWNSCTECGDCVEACGPIGAIDLRRDRLAAGEYDQIVLDASSPQAKVRRLGVVQFEGNAAAVLNNLLGNLGQWEKLVYVENQPQRCAFRYSEFMGCGLCLDACPYGLISTTPDGTRKAADRYSCIGCGTCTAACPNEALQQVLPSDAEVFARVEEFSKDQGAVLYFCSQCGERMLEALKRHRHHIPAPIYPLEIPCLNYFTEVHALDAVGHGLRGVFLWGCAECPHTKDSRAEAKVALVNQMLASLDAVHGRVRLWRGRPDDWARILNETLETYRGLSPMGRVPSREPLPFTDRRGYIVRILEEIWRAYPAKPVSFPVDATVPYGRITVDRDRCTLCRACVGACRSHAFMATDEHLKHFPLRCTACELCVQACPESCISLSRQFVLDGQSFAFHSVVTSETLQCPRCGKPVGTKRTVEAVRAKLVGVGTSEKRLRVLMLCADCRAIESMLDLEEDSFGR